MKHTEHAMSRRKFLAVSGAIAGTSLVDPKSQILAANIPGENQNSCRGTR